LIEDGPVVPAHFSLCRSTPRRGAGRGLWWIGDIVYKFQYFNWTSCAKSCARMFKVSSPVFCAKGTSRPR